MAANRLAVDIGGTFVDFVLLDEETGRITVEKEPSSEKYLTDHILKGIESLEVKPAELGLIVHGLTVVINTILQERGGVTGLITTKGFRDVLELGRGNRPEVYNLLYKPPKPLVPRYLRFEVPERLNCVGEVLVPLDEEAVRQVAKKLKARRVEAVAVCFLHAYANPVHEERTRQILQEVCPGMPVAISSEITGEFREFERTSTTVLNAYVMPRMAAYMGDLEAKLSSSGYQGELAVMQTTGGMMSARLARQLPIRTLESGPAGGVIGAVALGRQIGSPDLIAADVGGTSFDVALIVGGRPFEKAETLVNKRPVLQPTVDIVSVGAGGGSIAWLDHEGALRVGPRSAEADPGPVCFGRGGTEPTVTDAHLVLGRINPDFFLGQRMKMHVEEATQAIQEKVAAALGLSLLEAAYGITRLADTNMINAIRMVTIERGHDPRQFSLLCYGGGGGLFAGSLAKELQIPRAIIPLNPAVFSAWGILNADFREDVVKTKVRATASLTAAELIEMFNQLAEEALAKLKESGVAPAGVRFIRMADMRYEGQEHTVRVPLPANEELNKNGLSLLNRLFDQLHEQAYAHASPGTPTEIVNLRTTAIKETAKPRLSEVPQGSGDGSSALKGSRQVYFPEAGEMIKCPIYDRQRLGRGDRLAGPAVVEEWSSTIVVSPGQKLEVDRFGDLVIQVS